MDNAIRNSLKVFVSYAHEDIAEVQKYVSQLQMESGIQVFWDRNIPVGSYFPQVLATAAIEAGVLIVFVSKAASASKFVLREVLSFEERGENKLIPVFLESIEANASQGLSFVLKGLEGVLANELGFDKSYRQMLEALKPGQSAICPIVTVMGTKGGTGKSTVIAAMAELIASTGASVLIIDADLETTGITKYLAARVLRRSQIYTVLDATYAHSAADRVPPPDKGIWTVTPEYLRDQRFGDIFLVPARLDNDDRLAYEALANCQSESERNAAAISILREMMTVTTETPGDVKCVFIDSGAENNPLVSASFILADYGFIVSSPNPDFRTEVARAERMHRHRYPTERLNAMNVIVNQATPGSQAAWSGTPHVHFVPEDSTMRSISTQGTFDFNGVGLNNFYLAVLRVMLKTFTPRDQKLLPDEESVWIKPYLESMATFPESMLRRPRYRFLNLLAVVFGSVLLVTLLLLSQIYIKAQSGPASWEISREIVKPDSESETEFSAKIGACRIPPEFTQRISIDKGRLTIKTALSPTEIARLKPALSYPPVRDAFIESVMVINSRLAASQARSQLIHQNVALGSFLFVGLLIVGAALYSKLVKQKWLLNSIVRMRKSKPEAFIAFLKTLVQTESGKPQLRWLRSEFRKSMSGPDMLLG